MRHHDDINIPSSSGQGRLWQGDTIHRNKHSRRPALHSDFGQSFKDTVGLGSHYEENRRNNHGNLKSKPCRLPSCKYTGVKLASSRSHIKHFCQQTKHSILVDKEIPRPCFVQSTGHVMPSYHLGMKPIHTAPPNQAIFTHGPFSKLAKSMIFANSSTTAARRLEG